MRAGPILFTVAFALAWAALLYVSVGAVSAMGANAAGLVFFGDFHHPWRAQFNTDFAIHLLLVAVWMIWRARSWAVGIVCAILAINLGGLFTVAFLLIALWQAGGDIRPVLLGRHWNDPVTSP